MLKKTYLIYLILALAACRDPSVKDLVNDRNELSKIEQKCAELKRESKNARTVECLNAEKAQRQITITKIEKPYNDCIKIRTETQMQVLENLSQVSWANIETVRRNAIFNCIHHLPDDESYKY